MLSTWAFSAGLSLWRRYAFGAAPACGSKEGNLFYAFQGFAPLATYLSALRAIRVTDPARLGEPPHAPCKVNGIGG